jgi:hypothetical protein
MDAIGKVIGFVILMTFAVDCVVSAARSLLVAERIQNLRRTHRRPRSGDKLRARVRQNVLLGILSGALCLVVVNVTDLRIGRALNTGTITPLADAAVTWIILIAGADRFRQLLQRMEGAVSAPEKRETPAVRLAIENDGNVRAMPKAV